MGINRMLIIEKKKKMEKEYTQIAKILLRGLPHIPNPKSFLTMQLVILTISPS